MPTIIIKDPQREAVEAASGGSKTVIYDDKGNPCIMNIIPKFNLEDINPALGTGVHPAFIVGGKEKSEIFISTYKNQILDGRAVSMPGTRFSIVTRAEAREACKAKGPGWHLMTNHEWAAIALWCAVRDIKPTGNSDYGRSHKNKYETGVRWDKAAPGSRNGESPYTLTGSGPKEWNHDQTPNGIADLVGNAWEHVDLLELRDGRFYTPIDNNYDMPEEEWPAMNLWVDAKKAGSNNSTSESDCGTLFSDSVTKRTNEEGWENPDYGYSTWSSIEFKSGLNVPLLAKQLMIAPLESAGASEFSKRSEGFFYHRNQGKRIALRAGNYSITSDTGLGCLVMLNDITARDAFRSAYMA